MGTQRDGSFEHPKHMSKLMGKKIFTISAQNYYKYTKFDDILSRILTLLQGCHATHLGAEKMETNIYMYIQGKVLIISSFHGSFTTQNNFSSPNMLGSSLQADSISCKIITVKSDAGLQRRVCIRNLFSLFLIQNICCGY